MLRMEVLNDCTKTNLESGRVVISITLDMLDDPIFRRQLVDKLGEAMLNATWRGERARAEDIRNDIDRVVHLCRALDAKEPF